MATQFHQFNPLLPEAWNSKKLPEEPRILLNAIQCRSCKDVIVSYNTRDFKWCGCHSVAVDGGRSYLKRAGDPTSYVEMSVTL